MSRQNTSLPCYPALLLSQRNERTAQVLLPLGCGEDSSCSDTSLNQYTPPAERFPKRYILNEWYILCKHLTGTLAGPTELSLLQNPRGKEESQLPSAFSFACCCCWRPEHPSINTCSVEAALVSAFVSTHQEVAVLSGGDYYLEKQGKGDHRSTFSSSAVPSSSFTAP